MKSLAALGFIAALSAFVLLPFEFVTAGSILFAAGLAGIAIADYSRGFRSLRVAATGSARAVPRTERFRLAA